MYKLTLKKSARKELLDLPFADFLRVDKAILSLKKQPRPFPQSKKLKSEDKYRLRVGDYRVIYTINEKEKAVVIATVCLRKDAY